MEDIFQYSSINWILMFCVLNIFLPAEANQVLKTVSSSVILRCHNESTSNFTQLTWMKNGVHLFSYSSTGAFYHSPEPAAVNLSISRSALQLYALIINEAQTYHTGNYSCVSTTINGVFDQTWELIVTEKEIDKKHDRLLIYVGTAVACVCVLVFILTWIGLRKRCKKHKEDLINSRQEKQTEDIYENSLELQKRNAIQPLYCKVDYHSCI